MATQILGCVARSLARIMYTTGTYVDMTQADWDRVEHEAARALCCNLKDVRKVTRKFKV